MTHSYVVQFIIANCQGVLHDYQSRLLFIQREYVYFDET